MANKEEIKKATQKYLNYHLGSHEEYRTVDKINVRKNFVEVEYSVDMAIPVGIDRETGQMEYEYDTEFRTTRVEMSDIEGYLPSSSRGTGSTSTSGT